MKGNKLFLFSLCLISQLILAECKRNRKWNVGGKSKKWNFGGKNEEQIKKAYYCTRTNLFDSKHSPKQIGGLEGIGSLFKVFLILLDYYYYILILLVYGKSPTQNSNNSYYRNKWQRLNCQKISSFFYGVWYIYIYIYIMYL